MSELTVVTPPDGEALSLVAAKDFLRIGHEGEDALVADLISAATARLEAALGISLVSRMYERVDSVWPHAVTRGGFNLSHGPVTALTSVEVIAPSGERILVTERFELRGDCVRLKPFMALPYIMQGGGVAVTYEAGFGAAADVPADLRQALKEMVVDGYARADMRVPEGVLMRKRVSL